MIIYLVLFLSSAFLSTELKEQLINLGEDEEFTVIVHIKAEYPYDLLEHLPIKEKAEILKVIARETQKPLVDYLRCFPEQVKGIEQFWVFNGLHIRATKRIINEIIKRDDIKYVLHDGTITIPETKKLPDSRIPEWNISKVRADSCWNAGYTGDGIMIGHLDTGCDFTHPALSGKWSGYWRDCVNGQSQPYDDNGHGTLSAGIICGGDGSGPFINDIGVAPGAKLVCAKIFDQNGSGLYTWIDAGMQWIADLKVDSGVDIRAVSNSWGAGSYDLHFWNMCLAWKSIGILGIWSIGSSGPGQGTCSAPGNYPLVLGSGATDASDYIASFSSRGPAPDLPPWNDTIYWYRRDWNLTKPDIVAPGVNIRASYNGGGYVIVSGTSWTNPHIAGSVAILCEANPNLTVTELYNLFLDNADATPGGNPNNTYGWGRLNVWRTLQSALNINEKESNKPSEQITILPNPCQGRIKIEPSDVNHSIILYDITGRKIYKTTVPKNLTILDLPTDLKNGVYFLRIETQKCVATRKIVLSR